MFPFLQIKRYKDFDKNILLKIDAIAEKQGKTRSDLVRDILYARFGYIPLPRSPEQVNEDRIEERHEENLAKHPDKVARVRNFVFAAVEVHNDPADDNNQHPGKNYEA